MDFRYSITADEREALYNEIWSEPVTTVAARYNLSDNGLRKHCRKYGIPLPPPGYWARIKAGQKVQKPALPEVTGEIRNHVRNYVIKYRPDIDRLTDDELSKDEGLSLLREETKTFIRETCSKIQVPGQLRKPHHLITEHKEEAAYRKNPEKRVDRRDSRASYQVRINNKYCFIKPMLPVHVSHLNITRAYRILNAIINTLEGMESYTNVGQDSGKDTGYFRVMNVTFNFELTEEVRRKRKNDDSQAPYLVLSLLPKSWFSSRSGDRMQYMDHENEPLELQIGKIIYDMFVVANKIRIADELDKREQKRQEEERERQRRLEKMRAGELEEIKVLEQAASDWDRAQKIRRFTDCMEQKVAELDDEKKKEKLLSWLEWARNKADWLDPLTEKEDKLLGKSQHLFALIEDADF